MTRVKLARPLRPAGPQAGAGGFASRPLGEILVGRGALSSDELEAVLLQQRTTHKRLGAILVGRGTLTQPELTDALRDQLSALGPPPTFERDGVLRSVARTLRTRPIVRVRAGRRRLPDLTLDLDRRARNAANRHAQARDQQVNAEARLTAELADLRAELNHTHRLVVMQGVQLARLLAREPQIAEPADEIGVEPPPVSGAEHDERPDEHAAHLVFKPAAAGGYELLEREGPPPVAGETVEIDDCRFTVTRFGRSPLPGDERACAYLHADVMREG